MLARPEINLLSDLNNKTIAIGETVKVGENFGLKISQIGDVKQVIQSLGNG